jgi:hypothetical protein
VLQVKVQWLVNSIGTYSKTTNAKYFLKQDLGFILSSLFLFFRNMIVCSLSCQYFR